MRHSAPSLAFLTLAVFLGLALSNPAQAQYNTIGRDFTVRTGTTSPTLTERMRITQGGMVGIGISTPTTPLEVSGTVSATAFMGDGSQLTNVVTGYTGALISGSKTGNDCMDAGGRPTAITGGYICQFGGGMLTVNTLPANTDCPTGWSSYSNWSRTVVTTCSNSGCSGCSTGSHAWSNTAPETCTYKYKNPSACTGNSTCTADYFSMGCI